MITEYEEGPEERRPAQAVAALPPPADPPPLMDTMEALALNPFERGAGLIMLAQSLAQLAAIRELLEAQRPNAKQRGGTRCEQPAPEQAGQLA